MYKNTESGMTLTPNSPLEISINTNNNGYDLLLSTIPDTEQVLYILFNLMISIILLKVELGFYFIFVTQRLCYSLSLLPASFQDEGQDIQSPLNTSSINMYRFIIHSFIHQQIFISIIFVSGSMLGPGIQS